MADELIPVTVDCRCPETPHESDTVYLRPRLGLAAGIAVQKLIVDARNAVKPANAAELTGALAEAYLLHGVADWTFTAHGQSVPVNPDTIVSHLLDDFGRAAPVADAADELYLTAVVAPLLKRASIFSRATSSSESTSARGNGARQRPKRSKRSSTSTSRTDATERTSE